MNANPDQFTLDCKNYRMTNGAGALYPYYARKTAKLYIVKSLNADEVVLTEVFGDSEIQVSPSDFAANFGMWIQDESVFFFGTKDQQATAHAQWDRVIATMNRVLYARKLPVTA